MTRTIHHIEQRSPEWYQLRVGRLTASVAGQMFAYQKDGKKEKAERRDLRCRLALESITGVSGERPFDSPDLQRGREMEAEALAAYEARTGLMLDRVGFVSCAELPIGCSPDGALVSGGIITGGVDVKNPRPANHLAYLKDPSLLVADYETQCGHTLLVTGAGWWDLASYCPSFPGAASLLIVTVLRAGPPPCFEPRERALAKAVDVAAYELMVRSFLREVEQEAEAIRQVIGPKEAA